MLRNYIVGIIIFMVPVLTSAQSKIAKLTYEEAEEAYDAGDFKTTMIRLDEAEKLFGKTNPPMLYLRIITLDTIVAANIYHDYNDIVSLRTNCSSFLKDYAEVPNIEDKYRTVYRISQKIKQYPQSSEQFNEGKQKIIAAEIKKKEAENDKAEYAEIEFKQFRFYNGYDIGLTVEEAMEKYPLFKKRNIYQGNRDWDMLNDELQTKGIDYLYTKKTPWEDYDPQKNPSGFYIKNNKLIGYTGIIARKPASNAKAILDTYIERMSASFDFQPEKKMLNPGKGMTENFSFSWAKNGRQITLQYYDGAGYGFIHCYVLDYNLIN